MMQLIALKCPTCGQNLLPKSNEAVVISCLNCLTAVSLHQSGIKAIPISYAKPTGKADVWLPMWVYNGRVILNRRKSQGSSKGAEKDAAKTWDTVQRLFAPAWQEAIPQAREIGSRFTLKQPMLSAIEPTSEDSFAIEATVSQEDGLKLLDFIVLSVEAGRKDWLQDVQFEIQVNGQELWALPARKNQGTWEFLV